MRVPVPDVLLPADQLGRVHFIGIGGAGLSAIARIMAAAGRAGERQRRPGHPVPARRCARSASPATSATTPRTSATPTPSWSPPPPARTTRRCSRPAAAGLRMLPRSAGLAAVMAGRRVLAVAGTHGKTTTTGLLTSALLAAGADPTYAVGGVLTATGRNADAGSDDLFVAEADESDGAFLVYRPHAAIVTNVEADHLDNWGTEEAYHAAFEEFAGTIDRDGFLVVVGDDPGAAALATYARADGLEVITVGEGESCDLRLVDVAFEGTTSRGRVLRGGSRRRRPGAAHPRPPLPPRRPGRARGRPAPRATTPTACWPGWPGFTGTGRRMELKGEAAGVRVYDSYAHHPVEIAGDLQAARAVVGDGRLVVAFQPHLVSRTRIFGEQMGVALGAADEVVVLDVYLAREDADPAVTGALVADAVPLDARARPLRARLRRRARGPRRPRPPRRPGADPRAPAASPSSGPGSSTCCGTAVASATRTRPTEEERREQRVRQRFARRQWARRWMHWRVVVAVLVVVALVATSVWLVFFSAVLVGQQGRGRRQPAARPRPGARGRRGADGRAARPGRPRGHLAPGRGAGRGRGRRRHPRPGPTASASTSPSAPPIAVVELGGRLRGLDADGVVFRDYRTAPKGMPRVRPTTSTGSDALAEAAGVVAVLPQRPRRPRRPRRGADHRPDHPGAARRPPGAVGECGAVRAQGAGAARAARRAAAPRSTT